MSKPYNKMTQSERMTCEHHLSSFPHDSDFDTIIKLIEQSDPSVTIWEVYERYDPGSIVQYMYGFRAWLDRNLLDQREGDTLAQLRKFVVAWGKPFVNFTQHTFYVSKEDGVRFDNESYGISTYPSAAQAQKAAIALAKKNKGTVTKITGTEIYPYKEQA